MPHPKKRRVQCASEERTGWGTGNCHSQGIDDDDDNDDDDDVNDDDYDIDDNDDDDIDDDD